MHHLTPIQHLFQKTFGFKVNGENKINIIDLFDTLNKIFKPKKLNVPITYLINTINKHIQDSIKCLLNIRQLQIRQKNIFCQRKLRITILLSEKSFENLIIDVENIIDYRDRIFPDTNNHRLAARYITNIQRNQDCIQKYIQMSN